MGHLDQLTSMFSKTLLRSSFVVSRYYSSSVNASKVAVLGAAGGIGQPLSLLLKNDSSVKELNLFDIVNTPGVAADLSHISSPATVRGFVGQEQLGESLKGCDDLFNTNAGIVQSLAQACAEYCPNACLLIISNPVNSTVPIVAETLKKAGVYDKNKLFGVTTLDVTRARTFISELKGCDVNSLDIPVVGGHAGTTIVPLLSRNSAGVTFSDEERDSLTHRIQFGGDEVVKAKDGAGSATLSMAYAGAQFTLRLLAALNGEKNVVECTLVESTVTDSPYFATPVTLGPNGVDTIHDLGSITDYEREIVNKAVPDLIKSAEKGVAFVNK